MNERRRPVAADNPLLSIFRELDAAPSSEAEEKAISEIVKFGLQESDLFEVTAAMINKEARILSSPTSNTKRSGQAARVLRKIDESLRDGGIRCKIIGGSTKEDWIRYQEIGNTTSTLLDEVTDESGRTYAYAKAFVDLGRDLYNTAYYSQQKKYVYYVPGATEDTINNDQMEAVRRRKEVLDLTTQVNGDRIQTGLLPDRFLQIAKRPISVGVDALDIYHTEHGRASLRDLESIQGQEKFDELAIEYIIAGINSGDAFWKPFVTNMLLPLQPYMSRDRIKGRDFFNPRFIEKIYRFTERLYIDIYGLDESKKDEVFGLKIKELLGVMDKEQLVYFPRALAAVPYNSFYYESFFNLKKGSFSSLVDTDLMSGIERQVDEYPERLREGVRAVLITRMSMQTVRKAVADIKDRFGSTPNTDTFCESMKKTIKDHVDEEWFVNINKQANRVFKDQKKRPTEKELQNQRKIDEGARVKYLDKLYESFYSSSYSKDTLGERLGYKDIALYWGLENTLVFDIRSSGAEIVGKILPDGGVDIVSGVAGDFRKKYPFFHQSIEQLLAEAIVGWKETDLRDEEMEQVDSIESVVLSNEMIEGIVQGLILTGVELTYPAIAAKSPELASLIKDRRMLSQLRRKFLGEKEKQVIENTDYLLIDLLDENQKV